jgi:glycosyltransferase involved in cell wall biosynthesis
MKILISTPLFPPEVAYPANFSKNLARHLSLCGYDVVLTTFSNHPEQIQGVTIYHVKKSQHLLLRMFKFYFVLIKNMWGRDLVILKQAGFSSFVTLLVAKTFGVKTILKLKEDEVEVRIKNQKIDKDSFTIWRVRKLQQFIFQHVDFILFADEQIKNHILRHFNLNGVNIAVLEHPDTKDILHYGDVQILEQAREKRNKDWSEYVKKIIEYAK